MKRKTTKVHAVWSYTTMWGWRFEAAHCKRSYARESARRLRMGGWKVRITVEALRVPEVK